jgi:hypothetical protein
MLEIEETLVDSVILPSTCGATLSSDEFYQWAKAEVYIRVGIGHDLLQELRISAGLHSYYVRRQKHSRGRAQMEKVAKSQNSASKRKSKLIGDYIKNWRRISEILKANKRLDMQKEGLLKGLQQLNKAEDVKFFEEWGSRTGDYSGFSNLSISWIWRVAMEGQPGSVSIGGNEIKTLTDSWESEGI